MKDTLSDLGLVTKDHMDAIEPALWGKTVEPEARSVEGMGASHPADYAADPETEYPVAASIAALPKHESSY